MPKKTRDRILEAGLMLFSKRGYLGTTTKEIAKEAGVAELTIFRHFTSKERLFGEIIKSNSFLPALKGILPEIKNLGYQEALTMIAMKFLERLSERRQLIRIMHAEIQLYPETVREIYHNFIDEIFGTLASYFKELQDKGALRDFDPELGAKAFLGMFFSYFNSQNYLSKKKVRPATEQIVNEFIGIFIKGTVK